MITRRKALALVGAASFVGGVSTHAQAQAGRALSIIVPQPAGNPTDGVARKVQPLLQKLLQQTVVVENLPGAGGSIGAQRVLNQAADGRTLLIASQTEPILTPLSLTSVRYKAEDWRAVGLVGRAAYVLAGRPSLEAKNYADLLALMRKSDKPLAYGHIGDGSMIHLLGEEWARLAGVKLIQVPYKGVPPVIQDVMAGQIDLTFLPMGGSTPALIAQGKVKAFGISTAERNSRLPDVPALSQLMKKDDFVYGTWAAFLAPHTLADAEAERFRSAIYSALADPDVQTYLREGGLESGEGMSLAELDGFYKAESQKYQGLASRLASSAR